MKGTSPSQVRREAAAVGIAVPRWEVRNLIHSLAGWKGQAIVTLGIDPAKKVFAVHGVDTTGQAVLVKPQVARATRLELIASIPAWPH